MNRRAAASDAGRPRARRRFGLPARSQGLPGCGKTWVLVAADATMQSRAAGAVEFGPGCRPAVPLAWQVRFEGRVECIQVSQHRRTEVARQPDRRDGERGRGGDASPDESRDRLVPDQVEVPPSVAKSGTSAMFIQNTIAG